MRIFGMIVGAACIVYIFWFWHKCKRDIDSKVTNLKPGTTLDEVKALFEQRFLHLISQQDNRKEYMLQYYDRHYCLIFVDDVLQSVEKAD